MTYIALKTHNQKSMYGPLSQKSRYECIMWHSCLRLWLKVCLHSQMLPYLFVAQTNSTHLLHFQYFNFNLLHYQQRALPADVWHLLKSIHILWWLGPILSLLAYMTNSQPRAIHSGTPMRANRLSHSPTITVYLLLAIGTPPRSRDDGKFDVLDHFHRWPTRQRR